MSNRKYSVEEINRMRSATWELTMVPMQIYSGDQLDRQVEERLRTFMENGTDPEELDREVTARREKRMAKRV